MIWPIRRTCALHQLIAHLGDGSVGGRLVGEFVEADHDFFPLGLCWKFVIGQVFLVITDDVGERDYFVGLNLLLAPTEI